MPEFTIFYAYGVGGIYKIWNKYLKNVQCGLLKDSTFNYNKN